MLHEEHITAQHKFDYLNEIQPGSTRWLHQQDSYVCLWCLDATVDHAQKDCWIAVEVDHQLLSFLHDLLELCWADGVSVVKEEVTFTCQLYLQMCHAKLRYQSIMAALRDKYLRISC